MHQLNKILKKECWLFLLMALVVFTFNYPVIFDVDVVIGDDRLWYNLITSGGKVPFEGVHHYSEKLAWNLMAHSLTLTKLIYLLFLLVPISITFYILISKYLKIDKKTAFFISVLPQILPYQVFIPTYINGSYVLLGLLLFNLSLLSYGKSHDEDKPAFLLLSVFLYFLSLSKMPQALFLFPALIVFQLSFKGLNKKLILSSFPFLLVFLWRFYLMLVEPPAATTPVELPLSTMLDRFNYYFIFSLPIYGVSKEFYWLIISIVSIGIIGLVLFCFFIKEPSERRKNLILISFFSAWYIFSIFPFVTASEYFTVRYSYIASYGLLGLLGLMLQQLTMRTLKHFQLIFITLIMFVILLSGLFRLENTKNHFETHVEHADKLRYFFSKHPLPHDSQLVILDHHDAGGFWGYSSGYIKQVLGRNDLNGLLGSSKEMKNFVDPTDISKRSLSNSMTGVDLQRPLYLFSYRDDEFMPIEYFLKWGGSNQSGNSTSPAWELIKLDLESGKPIEILCGEGGEEYKATLETLNSKGVRESDILWSGSVDEIPLGVNEANLVADKKRNYGYSFKPCPSNLQAHFTGKNLLKSPINYSGLLRLEGVMVKRGENNEIGLNFIWKLKKSTDISEFQASIQVWDPIEKSVILGRYLRLAPVTEVSEGEYFIQSLKLDPSKLESSLSRGISKLTLGISKTSPPTKSSILHWSTDNDSSQHKTLMLEINDILLK